MPRLMLPKDDKELLEELNWLVEGHTPWWEIARRFNVSVSSLHRAVQRRGLVEHLRGYEDLRHEATYERDHPRPRATAA